MGLFHRTSAGITTRMQWEHVQVLFSSTRSSLSRLGMAAFPRPSGLKDRLPDPTALAYSRISRYSGFLYHVSHDGNCIVMC